MTFIYLIRHGETDWNLARRIQGSTDIPLNETGRIQARATGQLLSRRSWDAVVSSPLSRACETASIIASQVGLEGPTVLEAVVERNYGAAEGLSDTELDARFPGDTPVPGRETRAEVASRVLPALMRLAEAYPGQAVIVVSHGGVIRTVLNEVGPEDSPHRTSTIPNGSIHSFQYIEGELVLVAFDDPIEDESHTLATANFREQNALERRDA